MALKENSYQRLLREQEQQKNRLKNLQQQVALPAVDGGAATQAALDGSAAYSAAYPRAGVQGATETPESTVQGAEPTVPAAGYVSPYIQHIEAAMGELQGMQFSYDPATDPNYQAMRKQYLLEAQRSQEDVLAQAAASTGGRASSYAVTAASQAADYYKSQMNAQQLALFENAYQTYYNNYAQKLDEVQLLQSQDETAYSRWMDEQQMSIEEQTRVQALKDAEYERLVTLIASTGYAPNAEELAASGMTAAEAAAWKAAYERALATGSGSGGGGGSYYDYSGFDSVNEEESLSMEEVRAGVTSMIGSGDYSGATQAVEDAFSAGWITEEQRTTLIGSVNNAASTAGVRKELLNTMPMLNTQQRNELVATPITNNGIMGGGAGSAGDYLGALSGNGLSVNLGGSANSSGVTLSEHAQRVYNSAKAYQGQGLSKNTIAQAVTNSYKVGNITAAEMREILRRLGYFS